MKIDNDLPIGVFDSGAGGLTVAKEILKNLPNEKIIYFGDTARVPYGNKSPETIIRYSRQITKFLLSNNVKAITVACNTATALALETLKNEFDIPIIGVIVPGSEAAVSETKNHRIGVTGTTGTIKSGLYEQFIRSLDPEAKVFSEACPLFVPLVEAGMIDDPITIQVIHRYLDELIAKNDIDTLILGCTHYPLLLDVIRRELGDRNITLVNPAYETACALRAMLEKEGLSADPDRMISPADHRYYVSDGADSFREFAEKILGIEIDHVDLKVLE